jgi:hypothetical protein
MNKLFKGLKDCIYWRNFFLYIILLFLLVLYIQHSQLFYSADDFCRKLQVASLKEIITVSLSQYFNCCTGRYISTFIIYFFANGNLFFWKILNPLFIVSLVTIILYISRPSKIRSIGKASALCFVVYFFLTLNQYLAREVLYWMSGAITYLWPLTAALAFLFFWEKSFTESRFAQYSKYLSIIIAIFAGNSNEQVGIIFLFLTLCITWSKIRQGYRLGKIQYATIAILFIGVVLLLLAPGNFVKYNQEWDGNKLFYSGGVIAKFDIRLVEITSNIFYSILSETFLNLFAIISLLAILNLFFSTFNVKLFNKLILIIIFSGVILVSLLFKYDSQLSEQARMLFGTFAVSGTVFNINTLTTYVFWVGFIISLIYLGIVLFRQDESLSFSVSVVGAILSQTIMLPFPYSPNRTFFITLIFIVMGISYLIQRINVKIVIILVFLINITLLVNGFFYYQYLTNNYRLNKQIMVSNERIINDYKKTNSSSILYLNRLANDKFSFDLPYVLSDDWETPCFKKYYEIQNALGITWIP